MYSVQIFLGLLVALPQLAFAGSLASALGHHDHSHTATQKAQSPPAMNPELELLQTEGVKWNATIKMFVLKNGDCVMQGDIMLTREDCLRWAQRLRAAQGMHGNTEEVERTHAHGVGSKYAGGDDDGDEAEELEELTKRKSEPNTASEQLTKTDKNWRIVGKEQRFKEVKKSHNEHDVADRDTFEKSREHKEEAREHRRPVQNSEEHDRKGSEHGGHNKKPSNDHKSSEKDDHARGQHETEDRDSNRRSHHGGRDVTREDEREARKRSGHPHSPAGVWLYHKGRPVETEDKDEPKEETHPDRASPARVRGFSSYSGAITRTN